MATHVETLREQARALPEMPGVYFWKDARGRILYIGKAVDLRARVNSYFSTAKREARVRKLITQARAIEHEVCATELEALFRESALIKRELPPFNRALRAPRRFYFLKFDRGHPHPYLEVVREEADDGSLYFGPFRSATVARETVQFVHAVLPLRKCMAPNPRCKPCLYYHMQTCAAPFLGAEEAGRHEQAIAHLADLLDGRTDRVERWLEGKRDRLSEALMYERAAEIQQRLDTLREFAGRQAILDAAVQCRCVLIHCAEDNRGPERLLLVAHGSVLSVLPTAGRSTAEIARWFVSHEAVMQSIQAQERELDAASVLERWLAVNRDRVRWVAVPRDGTEDDLIERITYVSAPFSAVDRIPA